MKKVFALLSLVLVFSLIPFHGEAQAYAIPTFSIQEVIQGEEVTVTTYNFPAGYDFVVRMGLFGTAGIGGITVGTVNSGSGGSLEFTFAIPVDLRSESLIAIRMDATAGGFYAYNWFYNTDADMSSTATPFVPAPTSGGYYYGIPTLTILSVNEDQDVTIQANNFPADYDFDVLMGKMWTQGIGGTLVTTINSGEGDTFQATFNIPAALKGDYQIAIRLQTADHYFYAYNWFYNNTTSAGTATDGTSGSTTLLGYTGIPTFSITGVVQDNTVTILTNNFPAGYDFNVLMGKMWTQGIGGTQVTTIHSGTGGAFSKTFTIPAALAGEAQIAIRLEATSGGFYAYNWFYNTTTP
jgi:hypothetical protein